MIESTSLTEGLLITSSSFEMVGVSSISWFSDKVWSSLSEFKSFNAFEVEITAEIEST